MMFSRLGRRVFARNAADIRKVSTSGKSSSPETGESLWARYNHQLLVNPLVTKGITAGIIAFAADIFCQTYFPSDPALKNKPAAERIDWNRTFNFTVLNTLAMPIITHYWYAYLSTRIVGDTMVASIKRVFFDQAFFAPFIVGSLFASNTALQGNIDGIPDKLRNDLPSTMVANWSVWIPCQIINFRFVPPQLRVLWANFVGFFWSIYLSHAANKVNDEKMELGHVPAQEQKK